MIMQKVNKLVLAIIGLIGLAGLLALFVVWRNQLMSPTNQAKEPMTQKVEETAERQDEKEKGTGVEALSAEACRTNGGTWNDCGSLCRGKPAGTVCAQICVPQCECRSQDQCQSGYACTEFLSDGVGICTAKQNGEETSTVNPDEWANKEYRSSDGVTSVVLPEETLFNPFTFYGTSTAFENMISWTVVQSDDLEVARGNAYVNSPDIGIPGSFKVKGYYERLPTAASGTLNVFEASAKDGTPIHAVVIPVNLMVMEKSNTRTLQLYFGNSKKNPDMLDCGKVYPVKRVVPDDEYEPEVLMHYLLAGPTEEEKKAGYFTSLPEYISDPEVSGDELKFKEDLEAGVAGSCRVSAIRAQIIETWKNEYKTDPVISIDGRTEDILQP